MPEPKFLNGLRVKAPRVDFIMCHISIKREELIETLLKETDEWINLDVKVSQKEGKPWYAQINEWKPEENSRPSYPDQPFIPPEPPQPDVFQDMGLSKDDLRVEDIPF